MYYSNLIKNILTGECSIIGKEKYLNSAVLIPIVIVDEEEYFLFEKRSATVRQPGEISFPGGHFDGVKDKSFMDTAVRETEEELGLSTDKIEIWGRLGTLVTPMEVIVEAYIGVIRINNPDEIQIDKKEVDKVFLVPLKFFLDNEPVEYLTRLELHPFAILENGQRHELLPVKELGLPERYSESWTKGKHRVLVYHAGGEVIWGITAELIYEMAKKIQKKSAMKP